MSDFNLPLVANLDELLVSLSLIPFSHKNAKGRFVRPTLNILNYLPLQTALRSGISLANFNLRCFA